MTFRYHGSALGIGGRLDLPSRVNIPTQACAVLSPSGGESSMTVRDYSYQGILSFDEATAYATGSRDDDTYNTLAMVTIRNLSIFGMIEVERLVARITSTHRIANGKVGEAEITFTGSTFKGVTIGGVPIKVELDTNVFSRFPTFDGYVAEFQDQIKNVLDGADPRDGVMGTIVQHVDPPFRPPDNEKRTHPSNYYERADVRASRHLLHIPHFGTIVLGEVQLEKGYRRLNMLRVDLGCPITGSLTFGSVEGNGADIPP